MHVIGMLPEDVSRLLALIASVFRQLLCLFFLDV